MKKLTTVYIGLVLLIALTSCSVEKRTYMKGYHISQFNNHNNKKTAKTVASISENKDSSHNDYMSINENVTASLDNSLNLIETKKNLIVINKNEKYIKEEECDIIILKDGKEIKAKVLEITTSEIKYKECSNLNGPIFTKTKSDVFMVKYPNGTNTVIESIENKAKNNSDSNNNSVVVNINNSSKGNNTNKSQLVAIVLCLIGGIIGLHRFYLGYIGIGIIQLLTLGFFGIWFLIDLIRLLTGSLKPKHGEYKD